MLTFTGHVKFLELKDAFFLKKKKAVAEICSIFVFFLLLFCVFLSTTKLLLIAVPKQRANGDQSQEPVTVRGLVSLTARPETSHRTSMLHMLFCSYHPDETGYGIKMTLAN